LNDFGTLNPGSVATVGLSTHGEFEFEVQVRGGSLEPSIQAKNAAVSLHPFAAEF
jgi:hypothetical protein